MQKKKIHNIAFIDWQNLYRWLWWNLDYSRFRVYLRDKYHIEEAYYFIWYEEQIWLYTGLQKAWFIVVFNRKWETLKSNKKWNVDVNLAFHMMRFFIEEEFDKAILISGDGDYEPVIDYFIEKWKFLKVLAPNMQYCSSLYKKGSNFPQQYINSLQDLKSSLEYKKAT
jgi:uncharacterized LabA/DUF88 family protein